MYRLDLQRPGVAPQQNGQGYIEFIAANEAFQIVAEYANLAESVSFGNSEENRLLGEFRDNELLYEEKMSLLCPLIEGYPEEDDLFRVATSTFLKIQEDRDAMIVKLAERNPDLFASRIIESYRSVILSPDLKGADRMAFLRKHFFDLSPIDDPELLHAPVYNRKIIEYLRLYMVQGNSFSEQEDAFITAVDIIMANVSGNPELRTFAVEYLLQGFESFGMEKIQTYIVDTYVDETCETDVVGLAMERVKGYKKMAEGEIAADILIRSENNRMVRLSEVDSDYVLVIFWATHCEHCMGMMPDLLEWYERERPENVEIFAVSIDTVVNNWTSYLKQAKLPWINTHEPMGWEGKSAADYNIYATPTMFLLDRQRRIIARPFTMREVRKSTARIGD